MDNDRRFALFKELSHDPPFWFHHALIFCRFQRSQLNHLLKGSMYKKRPDDEPHEQPLTNAPSYIRRAIECGLTEPIFQSISEHTEDRDLEELVKLLMTTSQSMTSKFPWMFLAYLGTCNKNTLLVKKCINIIIGDVKEGKLQEIDEIGMSYMVWRFLVRDSHIYTEEWIQAFLELPFARHDWTFVHLASAYGDTECLEILLKQPCNQNNQVLSAATELEGFTPLHLAAYYGHPAIVNLLFGHADKLSPTATSEINIPRDRIFQRSPLHYASMLCYPEVVSILVKKWGCLGVDLQDRFGITSLHLVVCLAARGDSSKGNIVLGQLLEVSEDPNKRVSKDFALQKAAMLRFFLERSRYIESTTSTAFIPSPAKFMDAFCWCIPGFTFLHCIALYGYADKFDTALEHNGQALIDWAAEDCHGLNSFDYADAYSRFNDFFKAQIPKGTAIAEAHQEKKLFVNRPKAYSKLLEADEIMDQIYKLRWAYEVGIHLLSGSFTMALRTLEDFVLKDSFVFDWFRSGEGKKFKVDDEAWDHLEWALDKALHQDSEKTRSVISGPMLHPSDAQEIVLRLVRKGLLHGKSPKQRCLQWAIGNKMASLAEELVKDTECELLSVVPGGKHEESPLARASESMVARDMPGLLAAMELREDVKRRWFEDRQVYVDYANTLLVGAVLIAGLDFSGWLQPPRGYVDMGVVDMKRHAMQVFVWSSLLAFFLGMGTVVAGATGAMPYDIGTGQLVNAREKVRKSVVVASMLLVASIICLSISFSSALLAILPFSHNLSITSFLVVNGLCLCGILFSFIRRLQGLSSSVFTSLYSVSYTNFKRWVRNLFKQK